MMANSVDMQMLMSIDPSSGNPELFNQMSKGGLLSSTSSTTSPASLASSGAPSASSVLNDGTTDEKEHVATTNQLMQMMMQQQQKKSLDALLQQANPQILEQLLAHSGASELFSGMFGGMLTGNKHQEKVDTDENCDNSETPTPPPQVSTSLASTLAGIMLPTTSTSHTINGGSDTASHQSVIVNGSTHEDDQPTTPPSKKTKLSEEQPVTNGVANLGAPFDSLLLAQMGQLNQLAAQQSQNRKEGGNDNSSLLFSNLFPQSMHNLPLLFPNSLQAQFSGLHDFDGSLSSLQTPNKNGAVKRQYSSNGKNYCDICNKEVCNKYFLRTHMLKMHGIVIDENKTVIANIDTLERERMGNLSFRCDTCLIEFKERKQLRTHKQEVHGVMPLSTPRNNSASNPKSSMPSTPTLLTNNGSGEEKCTLCDKRLPSMMMMAHFQQEHLGNSNDLSSVLQFTAWKNAKAEEEKDPSILRCSKCAYSTKEPRNLEMHLERHNSLTDAIRRSSEEEEDEALKLTTEAAMKMVVQNDMDATTAALNLSLDKVKKEQLNGDEEKAAVNIHERNSHTSGSISPSGESLPEGYGKTTGNDKQFQSQTFLVRSNDEKGCFLGEFIATLPVRSLVEGRRQLVFDLLPTPATENTVISSN